MGGVATMDELGVLSERGAGGVMIFRQSSRRLLLPWKVSSSSSESSSSKPGLLISAILDIIREFRCLIISRCFLSPIFFFIFLPLVCQIFFGLIST